MPSTDFQPYLDVAVSVLSQKDLSALQKLKDFLQALPNDKQVEQTLGLATLHFAEHDTSVFEWIVAHQTRLEPELNLVNFTQRLVMRSVRDCGTLPTLDPGSKLGMPLQLTPKTLATLSEYLTSGELQLVKAFLTNRE